MLNRNVDTVSTVFSDVFVNPESLSGAVTPQKPTARLTEGWLFASIFCKYIIYYSYITVKLQLWALIREKPD